MSGRSYGYDFLAGVDPTGGHTFQYGIADAPKPSSEQNVRRAIGVAGGLLGGGLVVPAVISAVVTAARESPKGAKGIAKGFLQGLTRTNIGPIRALRAGKILGKVEQGATITAKEIQHLKGMKDLIPMAEQANKLIAKNSKSIEKVLESKPVKQSLFDRLIRKPLDMLRAGRALDKVEKGAKLTAGETAALQRLGKRIPVKDVAAERIKALAKKHGIPESETGILALYASPPDVLKGMQAEVNGEAAQSIAGLAISGVIGGGSALLQHRKGSTFGGVLTDEQRMRLTKESEAKYEAMKDELDKLSFIHLAPEQSYLVSSLLAKAISSQDKPSQFQQRPKYHGMMKTSASFRETFDEVQRPLSTWKRLMAEDRNSEQALRMLESLKRKRFGARINMI